MVHYGILPLAIWLLLLLVVPGYGFNLSPIPNYTFKQPSLKTFIPKTRSTLFGNSISLQSNGVLVGAPRAQSTLESQRNVNETGAVYHCSFALNATKCVPVFLERQERSEGKDHQMLGASMDGLGTEGDWFVVCAPKLKASPWLQGMCYLVENTARSLHSGRAYKITPFQKAKDKQLDKSFLNYGIGGQGFSVHVTDDGKEVLIGVPGVKNGRGTVIRYRQLKSTAFPPLSNVYREHSGDVMHETVVLDPVYSDMQNNSYLGYSVSSGRFLGTEKLLYVAGAPRSENRKGEVVIFDYENNDLNQMVMKRHSTLYGDQLAEDFGNSLLTEDFNNDGLPDLAVGAPMHCRSGLLYNGAVYVFVNKGSLEFNRQTTLSSSNDLSGQFGTALGKIGDINRDGYNDIAIGAPFEGNGAVYIYHGSAAGLQSKPSQRLVPHSTADPTTTFGYAISRGIDFDGNVYNDLAIGAPEDETVYVYRAYSVIQIEASINTTVQKLPAEGGPVEVMVCVMAKFPAQIPLNVTLQYAIDADASWERATLIKQSRTGKIVLVGSRTECIHFGMTVNTSPTTLHEPILIDVGLTMTKRAGPFYDHFALLDPNLPSSVQQRIRFPTGCKNDQCQSDLKIASIRWLDVSTPIVLGSIENATVEVEIKNSGENAFLSLLNITVPSSLQAIVKVASECEIPSVVKGHMSMLCYLNNRLPLRENETINYQLEFDMTNLEGDKLTVRVEALTSSKEVSREDNVLEYSLPLQKLSQIYIEGKTRESILLEKGTVNLTYQISLTNLGPSLMRDLILYINVPLTYNMKHKSWSKRCPIIDPDHIRAIATYNYTALEVEWIRPNDDQTFVKPKHDFFSGINPGIADKRTTFPPKAKEGTTNTTSWNNYGDLNQVHKKRFIPANQPTHQRADNVEHLDPGRSVFFNCTQNPSVGECLQLQIRLSVLPRAESTLQFVLHYKLDLDAIAACLDEQEEDFVLQIASDLEKPSDEHRNTYNVMRKTPSVRVTRNPNSKTPWWIIVLVCVLFLFVVISYILCRNRSFRRKRILEQTEPLHEYTNVSEIKDDRDYEEMS